MFASMATTIRHTIKGYLLFSLLPALALAAPVDTQQFGFISPGTPETELVRRLGPPDQVREEPPVLVPVWQNGQRVYRARRRATYFYAGDSQTLPAWFVLEDGVVLSKGKGR